MGFYEVSWRAAALAVLLGSLLVFGTARANDDGDAPKEDVPVDAEVVKAVVEVHNEVVLIPDL